jgi:hypothetical protein
VRRNDVNFLDAIGRRATRGTRPSGTHGGAETAPGGRCTWLARRRRGWNGQMRVPGVTLMGWSPASNVLIPPPAMCRHRHGR